MSANLLQFSDGFWTGIWSGFMVGFAIGLLVCVVWAHHMKRDIERAIRGE